MYDAKEQAKIYLDRIESNRKAVSPFLFIIIPIIILLLMGIAKHFAIVKSYISNQQYKSEISQKQKTYKKKIKEIKLTLSELNETKKDSLRTLSDSLKFFNAIKSVRNSRKNRFTNLSKYNNVQLEQNIRLQSQIDSLQIPFEIPLLKKTENLSIRSVVVIVMLLITSVLFFLLVIKKNVIALLEKFADLQGILSGNTNEGFKDLQISLPLCVFPLNNDYFRVDKPTFISDTMGFSSKQFRTYNLVFTLTWLAVLVLNIFLANMNWNINYKVYHTNYSLFIAFSQFLLLVDIFITYKLIKPVFEKATKPANNHLFSPSRAEFISLSVGTIAFLILEPINNLYNNGKKWFHNPRFKRKKKNTLDNLKPGIYTNISKSKKKREKIYYLSTNQKRIIKTVPDLKKFMGNLLILDQNHFLLRKYFSNIKPQDLLNHLRKTHINGPNAIIMLDNYLDIASPNHVPLELVDFYCTQYEMSRRGNKKHVQVHRKIGYRISEISGNPAAFLPAKYLGTGASIKDEDLRNNFIAARNKLTKQLLKRIERWKTKINNAGTSRSLM